MSRHVTFKGISIHYSMSGSGKAVVLLHGFMESAAIWRYFIRKFAADHTVIAIDLPGHGRSEPLNIPNTMEALAEAVNEVLRECSINACLLVGHSMGGYVGLAFAEKYPKKIKGLSLFHSHAMADSEEARNNRDRAIALVRKDRQGFILNFIPGLFDPQNVKRCTEEIEEMRELAKDMDRDAIIACMEGMKIRPDRTHILANATYPIQFIIGKNDPKLPLETVMPQTVLPHHSESVILDGVGHMGFYESREETFKALRAFAGKVL